MASRLAFRGKCDGVAWQKLLRDRYAEDGTPPGLDLDLKRAVVRPVSRRFAEQIILKYEWLGTMAATSWHFGLFFGEECAGVTCVGGTGCLAGMHMHKQFGVGREDVLVLARGSCVHWAPVGANSKLVALTCRLLAQERAGKLLIAYSDPNAGEIGTIYQACNWAYIGCTKRRMQGGVVVSPQGRVYNIRSLTTWAGKTGTTWAQQLRALQGVGWDYRKDTLRGRYAYVLDRSDAALVKRISAMRLPYPKRTSGGPIEGPVLPGRERQREPDPAAPELQAVCHG